MTARVLLVLALVGCTGPDADARRAAADELLFTGLSELTGDAPIVVALGLDRRWAGELLPRPAYPSLTQLMAASVDHRAACTASVEADLPEEGGVFRWEIAFDEDGRLDLLEAEDASGRRSALLHDHDDLGHVVAAHEVIEPIDCSDGLLVRGHRADVDATGRLRRLSAVPTTSLGAGGAGVPCEADLTDPVAQDRIRAAADAAVAEPLVTARLPDGYDGTYRSDDGWAVEVSEADDGVQTWQVTEDRNRFAENRDRWTWRPDEDEVSIRSDGSTVDGPRLTSRLVRESGRVTAVHVDSGDTSVFSWTFAYDGGRLSRIVADDWAALDVSWTCD